MLAGECEDEDVGDKLVGWLDARRNNTMAGAIDYGPVQAHRADGIDRQT